MATRKPRSVQSVTHAVTMFLVSALSLLLLIYVGYGEAQRNYYQFLVEEVTAQGRIVQNAIEGYLRTGLPLRQYVGFAPLVKPILESDEALASMVVVDRSGRRVFESGDRTVPVLSPAEILSENAADGITVRQSPVFYQIVLTLRNKFETVGSLVMTMPRSVVTRRIEASFRTLLFVAAGLSASFAVFALIGAPALAGSRLPWIQIGYGLSFLIMAAMVIGTLITLYADGAQAKTKALANSLGQRLSDIVAFNLNIDQFEGLDRTFGDYRKLNPDISAAGLTVNGIVQIHTDPGRVGKPWVSKRRNYEYVVDLSRPDKSANVVKVAVALPSDIVYRRVLRTVKNFAALFVASAFLAGLFLQFAGTVRQANLQPAQGGAAAGGGRAGGIGPATTALDLVKPVFFVAVFLEHLNYPFLPQFIFQITESSGLSAGYASAPFMAYYLSFALTLIPAGHFSHQFGPRQLIFWGLMLAAGGLLGLALSADLYLVILARVTAGIGQGMLFIGVQSYILATASPDKKTQGAAIIVIGFQGGAISGTAIGSLLVGYLGPVGVFTLAGATAVALAAYTILLVPDAVRRPAAVAGLGETVRTLGHDLAQVLRSADFLGTMMLIGVPAKAVMTGVVVFGLPLLLSDMGYAPEDIGQVIMLYAVGVLLSSTYVSRFVDRSGKVNAILFWGAAISGAGLMLIGSIAWPPIAESASGSTVVLIAGVAVLGIAHGFVWAPVITRVAESRISKRIGVSSVTATYRFLERIGHIAGPIVIGQMFVFVGQSVTVIAWVGAGIAALGLVFVMQATPARPEQAHGAT